MKKIIGLTLLSALLSACGGSDSKNPNVRLGGSNYGYSNNQIQPETKVSEKAPLNRLHVSGVGKSHGAQRLFRINEKDYDIIVPGMTNPNVRNGVMRHQEKNDGLLITRETLPNLQYSRAGMMTFRDEASNDYESRIFQQGVGANNLPSSGTASYKGTAVTMTGKGSSAGDINMNVDFGSKNLSGRLNNTINTVAGDQINGLDFSGQLSGNTFKANSGTTNFSGGLYGDTGEEFAGTLLDNSRQINGYFGGHRQ